MEQTEQDALSTPQTDKWHAWGEIIKSVSGGEYCDNLWRYHRRATQAIRVGEIGIGGDNPVRVQSMTTSRGGDVEESVRQMLEIASAGGELVRITAPTTADAAALGEVVAKVRQAGCKVPIVADIHFSPEAALLAARYVDKVRINPGNYCSAWAVTSEAEYQAALDEVERKLVPLLEASKLRGGAIRIGINHGSLSRRVTERYGAGVEGMVVSALEFIEICRRHGFDNLVLSLKASSPKVMVQANRLLCAVMRHLGWTHPLHLGVTEAGNALEGRVKSAIGIGSLLADGIGDTVRVSLTEPPAAEIPVGRALVQEVGSWPHSAMGEWSGMLPYNPYRATKLEVDSNGLLRNRQHGLLVEYADIENSESMRSFLTEGGYTCGTNGRWECGVMAVDAVLLKERWQAQYVPDELQGNFAVRVEGEKGWRALNGEWAIREATTAEVFEGGELSICPDELLFLRTERRGMYDWRLAVSVLREQGRRNGVVLGYEEGVQWVGTDYALLNAAAFGAALVDNIAVGIAMPKAQGIGLSQRREVGLAILQGVELRRSQAEIVACPGCGRTLFDLQSTLSRVKEAMRSQRHLKIGVMGCVVNGPGEMADADYGYVGAGHGRVTLYRGQQAVLKGIKEVEALDALKDLIMRDGKWKA